MDLEYDEYEFKVVAEDLVHALLLLPHRPPFLARPLLSGEIV